MITRTVRNQPRTTREDLVNDIRQLGPWPQRKHLVTHYAVNYWNTAAPVRSPAQESKGPSEVCQWFWGELGESVVVRWDKLKLFGINSTRYALGCFSATGTGQLHRIKGMGMIEIWSWMVFQPWQWPNAHEQGNKGVAQEEAHYSPAVPSQSPDLNLIEICGGSQRFELPNVSLETLWCNDLERICKESGQNPSWDVCKPGGWLQDASDLCACHQGFATKYWVKYLFDSLKWESIYSFFEMHFIHILYI